MVLADASTRPTEYRRNRRRSTIVFFLGPTDPRPEQGAAPAVTDLVGIPTRLQSAVASNEPQRFSSQLFNTQPKERVADAVASDPRFVAVKCRKRISEHLQTQAAKEAASAVSSAWITNSFITHTGKPSTPKVEREDGGERPGHSLQGSSKTIMRA